MTADADGRAVRLFGPEDHLRLLALHALRHGLLRPLWLCDVAAAVEGRPAGFDWDYFLRGDATRTRWAKTAIGLAHRVLGARLDGVPDAARWRTCRAGWCPPSSRNGAPGGRARRADAHGARAAASRPTLVRAVGERWPNGVEATVGAGRRSFGPGRACPSSSRNARAARCDSSPRAWGATEAVRRRAATTAAFAAAGAAAVILPLQAAVGEVDHPDGRGCGRRARSRRRPPRGGPARAACSRRSPGRAAWPSARPTIRSATGVTVRTSGGTRAAVATEAEGELAYRLSVVTAGDYRVRARLTGPPAPLAEAEIIPAGETAPAGTVALTPLPMPGWVDGGAVFLDRGAYSAVVRLPKGAALEALEVAPPVHRPRRAAGRLEGGRRPPPPRTSR